MCEGWRQLGRCLENIDCAACTFEKQFNSMGLALSQRTGIGKTAVREEWKQFCAVHPAASTLAKIDALPVFHEELEKKWRSDPIFRLDSFKRCDDLSNISRQIEDEEFCRLLAAIPKELLAEKAHAWCEWLLRRNSALLIPLLKVLALPPQEIFRWRFSCYEGPSSGSLLWVCIHKEWLSELKYVLQLDGALAEINRRQGGETAIVFAARCLWPPAVEELLKHGANPDDRDTEKALDLDGVMSAAMSKRPKSGYLKQAIKKLLKDAKPKKGKRKKEASDEEPRPAKSKHDEEEFYKVELADAAKETRPPLKPTEKRAVWTRFFGYNDRRDCVLCENNQIHINNFHAAHIIPWAFCHHNEPWNLFPTCSQCNNGMGQQNLFCWLAKTYTQRLLPVVKMVVKAITELKSLPEPPSYRGFIETHFNCADGGVSQVVLDLIANADVIGTYEVRIRALEAETASLRERLDRLERCVGQSSN